MIYSLINKTNMPAPAELATIPNHIEQMPLPAVDSVFIPEQLEPGAKHRLDISASLYDPADIESYLGFKASIPAVIEAGDKRLMLVDIRSYRANEGGVRKVPIGGREHGLRADFLLISPEDWDGKELEKGFKGIRPGEPVVFGREKPAGQQGSSVADRFDFSKGEVSRQHFSIDYNQYGQLTIEDLHSTNGTFVTKPDYTMQSSRTIDVQSRLREDPKFRLPDERGPNGYFDGDPILGRKSPQIRGGVYLGGSAREAITVKPEVDPRIDAVYDHMTRKRILGRLMKKATGHSGGETVDQLNKVYETVKSVMKYDGDEVEKFSKQFSGDQQVSLGDYIEKGIGVCRHQGLLSAYLIEKLIADGKMTGKIKIERNTIPEYGGTHAWATYTAENGTEYVIDAAQDFVGTKREARARSSTWDYYLPLGN